MNENEIIEPIYEEILARIIYSSPKAIYVKMKGSKEKIWIPKSLIDLKEIEEYSKSDYQVIKVKLWFCKLYNIDVWD